jgi:hypothetical protein
MSLLHTGSRLIMLHLVVCIRLLSIIQCARKIYMSCSHQMIDGRWMQTTRCDISLPSVHSNEIGSKISLLIYHNPVLIRSIVNIHSISSSPSPPTQALILFQTTTSKWIWKKKKPTKDLSLWSMDMNEHVYHARNRNGDACKLSNSQYASTLSTLVHSVR